MNKDYSNEAIKVRNSLAKTPIWNKEKQNYICQYCGGVVPTWDMINGYDCCVCGLPIHER